MNHGTLCLSGALFLSVTGVALAQGAGAPAPTAPPAGSVAPPAGSASAPPAGSAAPPAGKSDFFSGSATTHVEDEKGVPKKDAKGEELSDDGVTKLKTEEKFGTFEDEDPEKTEERAKPSDSNYYLGARFRDFIVPQFLFSLFASGGPDLVNVFTGGPEFVLQSGSLEAIFSITVPYGDYSMDEFLFKAKDDPIRAYEIVSSDLKLINVTVDLLGRIPLEKNGAVALLLGGGVGISGVLGNIYRVQAHPKDPTNVDESDRDQWEKCTGPGDPQIPQGNGQYCDAENDHYPEANGDDWSEPSWANGGSKPIIFPYIALPHIALEVLPIPELMMRLDTGFSVTGFFFGFAAGGRLPI